MTNPQQYLGLMDESWFSNPHASSFWLQVFTSAGEPYDELVKAYQKAINLLRVPDIKLHYGKFGGTFNRLRSELGVDIHGQIGGKIYDVREDIPVSPCLFISTPHKVDNIVPPEGATKCKLMQYATLLRSYIGSNCLFKLVHDAEHRADTGEVEMIFTDWFTAPSTCADPWLRKDLLVSISEVYGQARALQGDEKRIIFTAIPYFAEGIERQDFYSYWTCLELLASGKAPKIRSVLQQCYELKRQHDAVTAVGFAKIMQWRHDLIHAGRKVFMNEWVNRYIQFMIIDVMRLRLKMKRRKFAQVFARMSGVDLSEVVWPTIGRKSKSNYMRV